MPSKTVKIGIIGGGMMSQVGHLPFYIDSPRCRVEWLAETRPSLVDFLSKQEMLRDVCIAPDYNELLATKDVDAVIICAPRAATGQIALDCLNAGMNILTEKPMSHTLEQGRQLVEVASHKSLIYAVGYMKRYDPGIQATKKIFDELIASKNLGAFLYGRFFIHSKTNAHEPPPHKRPSETRPLRFKEWPLWPAWIPESLQDTYAWFMNSTSHDINLINFFFERALNVESAKIMANGSGVCTLSDASFLISLDFSKCETGRWNEGGELVFDQGRIVFSVPSPMNTHGVTRFHVEKNGKVHREHTIDTDSVWSFQRQADAFIDSLLGGEPPLTTGMEGLRDLELIEDIWRKVKY